MDKYFIGVFDSTNPDCGYNKDTGGSRGLATEETRQKMKDTYRNGTRKVPVFTEESRQKQNRASKEN